MGDDLESFWRSYSISHDLQIRRVFLHSFNQAFVRINLPVKNLTLEGWLQADSRDNGEFKVTDKNKEDHFIPYNGDFSFSNYMGTYDFKRGILPKHIQTE